MEYQRVVIVGVGLLGGSIGLALRERQLARQVIGVGRRETTLREALRLHAIDAYEFDLNQACRGADLAIVCTPVQQIAEYVRICRSGMLAEGLITDVGSTKATICNALCDDASSVDSGAALAEQFCGSHPLAGSDKSGVAFAEADLFVGKLTLVTPTDQTPHGLVARTEQFWQSLGSRTLRMGPVEHDRALAQISHLPHIVASALAANTPDELLPLAASGWRDTTRVAAGHVEMWRQILCENQLSVLASLKQFSAGLQPWIEALETGDDQRLERLLGIGKQKRDSVGN